MIRKFFVLSALVGLMTMPSTGWAADFRATLHVAASPTEGGTVTVSHDGYQHGGTALDSSKTWTFNVTATANQDWSFVGWFENSNCEGEPISTFANYDYAIKVGTKDYDSKEGKTIPGWYAKERTLYAKFVQHSHAFAYSIDGNTITKSCTAEGCPGGVGGTATLTANDATYDGKSHAASVSTTGDVTTELAYDSADGQAPTVAGTYEVTMKVDGGTAENSTLTKSFTINQASITALTLDSTSFNYDSTDKTTSIKSVKAGSLTLGENDYEVSGDAMTQVGSLTETKTYTVTVTGKGNFTGSASATWQVVAPSGEFKADALKPGAGCTANGNTVTVTDSTKLVYANGKWCASMTIALPHDQNKDGSYVKGATFVNAANTCVEYKGSAYTGLQIQGGEVPELTAPAETSVDYKYGLTYTQRTYKYLPSVTYTMELTPEIVSAAKADGKEVLEGSVTVYAFSWKDGQDYGTFGCETGLKPTTYTLSIPLEGIVLNDEYGNQVYPHVDFVAENGTSHKKFETLGAALTAATNAGETVTLIANAEAGAFEIGPGVTLNLAGFGNAGATYKLARSENAEATLKSTKAETVEAITGYAVVTDTETEPGVYIYTTELAHQHAWTFAVVDGTNLVATCGDPDTCTIAGGKLTMQLQGVADKEYDGSGINPSVVDIDVGGNKFREVIEGVTVGEITYTRPEYSAEKWYTGAYMASCVVTIGEVTNTLTKSFNILPKEYADGFVASVGGLSVRFDTLLEATTVANEGDTIYYKGGNLTGKEVTFSSSKNITLDLGGASLRHDAYETATLINSGAGTVTLTNGTIVQPKGPVNAAQMNIDGNFAFAEIETKNRATSGDNFFKLTVKSGTVTVLGGKYTSQFKTDGGTVVYQGGKFWDGKYNSRAYFSEPTPDAGYIVISGTESMDDGNGSARGLVWEVVAHEHGISYSAAGNVITASCTNEHGEVCGFGAPTLTLTAQSEQRLGIDTLGATKTESDGFPLKDLAIVYLDGEGQVVADIATAGAGVYTAQVTVADGVVAQVSFTIVADPIDLSETAIELAKGSFAYDGKEHTNAVKTATFGDYALAAGTDYTVGGDNFTQVGSPASNCTYTVTLTGIGKFAGSTNLTWQITAPTGTMGKLQEVKGEGQAALAGELEETTLTVTLTTNLCFLGSAWYAGLSVEVPNSVDILSSDNSSGTNTNDLRLAFSHEDDLYAVDGDSHTWSLSQKTIDYAKSITWFAQFPLAEIAAAIERGDAEIVRTMTVSAVPGAFNQAGIREVVYTIKLPLENLVLPVPAEQTLEAGDAVIDGFKLQLGKQAVVTANAQVADFAERIFSDGTADYAVTESGEGPYTYKNGAVSYQITYQFVGNDGNTPTNQNPTSYTVADAITFDAVTLDGYEFKGWNPAKIEAGTTGDQTVIGTFEKIAPPTIMIAIEAGEGVADVQTNGVAVIGALELPADATTVELTLVADGLTIPVYKVVRDDVTNVTSKTAVYTIAADDTLTFLAEEAGEVDPTVADDKIKQAIVDAIDEGDSHDAAVAKVGAVVGEDANQVSAKALAGYITDKNVSSEDLATSDYVAASVKLDADVLIDEETEVKIVELVKAEGTALTFEVNIDGDPVKVAAIKDMVEASGDLSDWENNKLEVEAAFVEGKVTITPKGTTNKAFMRIVIPKDPDIK